MSSGDNPLSVNNNTPAFELVVDKHCYLIRPIRNVGNVSSDNPVLSFTCECYHKEDK